MSIDSRSVVTRRRSFDERGRLLPKTPEQMEEYKDRAIRALDAVADIGTEEEQRETLETLMKGLAESGADSDWTPSS